ncbi:glycoside hydrolase family 55 protein [Qipengyuania gaetbuli]|uniref:glycoside hydrolase family 55 protein n=1 Tax=Qipengyuania gaetbuli TaxID=266952 RepID=UPI001C991C1A|nr:glycoside hydrolase family 55 protein [Qipengyuania gaetbuli]MBY6015886.1 glycoside hydrolase family 55 protein [Qipengyuania gaetbuli]
MNALAISSLALAVEAAQGRPCLFADLALKSPRQDAGLLVSSGHAAPGLGAGTYVCDEQCTPELLAAHPRFVVRTANGLIFRLLPESGAITPEQGGAAGDGVTDDQPAIQAAIDYAEAVGAQEVRFPAPRYRLDCPLRTSPADQSLARDGHPIVIRKSLVLKGTAAGRTELDFRALDGASAESDWQLVPTSASDPSLAVWRGGGIFVSGDTLDPGKGQRTVARLELDRLVLRGNREHTGNHAWPADPVTGDGWDITDKALWVQVCHVGEIVCRDTDMIGWKGEIFYLGGAIDAVERVELARCRFATTNGSAFNPGCNAEILATDCSFGDAFQAQEETGKSRAIYRNCVWHDCDHTTIGSGSTAAFLYHWVWPSRG